jgi:hypothetical protein
MRALTSGALQTCARALGTCESGCIERPARLFFMFETRRPQGIVGRVAARSPPRREAGSKAVGYTAHRSPPNGSRATIHVAASEPFLSMRQDPEPLDVWCIEALPAGPEPSYTWRRQSPSYEGGGIWSLWTHGSLRAHLGWEVGFSTAGHVAAHGCTLCSLS